MKTRKRGQFDEERNEYYPTLAEELELNARALEERDREAAKGVPAKNDLRERIREILQQHDRGHINALKGEDVHKNNGINFDETADKILSAVRERVKVMPKYFLEDGRESTITVISISDLLQELGEGE